MASNEERITKIIVDELGVSEDQIKPGSQVYG